jgi:putative transposase
VDPLGEASERRQALAARAWSPALAGPGRGQIMEDGVGASARGPGDLGWQPNGRGDAWPDGRPIKALSMCDEFIRENLARRLGRSITADDVTHALDDACALRGAPDYIRMDNGPEFVAMAIRDWCRAHGDGTAYIEPGSPWQDPYVESFNGKLRDELFSREVFDTIMEARLLFDDWCDTYNRHRPHSALGYLPPAVFAAAFNQPELS